MRTMKFSDEIRRAIDCSGLSRYEICKRAAIDKAAMSRFVAGTVGLTLATIDRLADVLGLQVESGKAKHRRGRPASRRQA